MPRAEELDEDFFALTMRRTLAEEQKGVNAGRNVAISDDTKRYRGLCVLGQRGEAWRPRSRAKCATGVFLASSVVWLAFVWKGLLSRPNSEESGSNSTRWPVLVSRRVVTRREQGRKIGWADVGFVAETTKAFQKVAGTEGTRYRAGTRETDMWQSLVRA